MPKKFNNKEEGSAYVSVHMWLKRNFGKATKCEKCGSANDGKRYEWANISGKYLMDRTDFMELCQSCHRKHDHGDRCKKGHEYTPENTYIRKDDGNRQCRACCNMATKRHTRAKRKPRKLPEEYINRFNELKITQIQDFSPADFRIARIVLNITLRHMAKATGLSNGYLSLLETGKYGKPSADVVSKLTNFFNSLIKEEKSNSYEVVKGERFINA